MLANLKHLYLRQIHTHCYKHSNAISYAPINVFPHHSTSGTGGAIVGSLTATFAPPTLGHLTYFLRIKTMSNVKSPMTKKVFMVGYLIVPCHYGVFDNMACQIPTIASYMPEGVVGEYIDRCINRTHHTQVYLLYMLSELGTSQLRS